MSFKEYLQENGYSATTISTYEKYLHVFIDWMEAAGLHPDAVTYVELLDFMRWLQEHGRSRDTVSAVLCVLRHYFNYRVSENGGGGNPAAGIYIKGITRKLPSGLLSVETLQELYARYAAQYDAPLCRRVILGLMIYQGLTVPEIRRLELADVCIRKGVIRIRGGRHSNGRELKLDASQVQLLECCLRAHGSDPHQPVMLGMRLLNGRRLGGEVRQLFGSLKQLNGDVTNAHQIRGSVITGWLDHYHVRQVQYMAGHKYASSTQRYQFSHLEDLQAQLQKYHPVEIGLRTNGYDHTQ